MVTTTSYGMNIIGYLVNRGKYNILYTEHRHTALSTVCAETDMLNSWLKKKKKKFHGDWHVSVQNMCFVKLQGHRSSVQRIRPWSIRYWEYLSNINNLACSHTYSSNSKQNNISWYKMCVLYVWLKSFIDHKNNRQKFGHTFLAEKKWIIWS